MNFLRYLKDKLKPPPPPPLPIKKYRTNMDKFSRFSADRSRAREYEQKVFNVLGNDVKYYPSENFIYIEATEPPPDAPFLGIYWEEVGKE